MFGSTGDQSSTDPLLSGRADNGGETLTHAISALSPVIDAGTNSGCPATDQKGVARPQDGGTANCDIGAYEVAFPDITVTDSAGMSTDLQVPFGSIQEEATSDQTVTVTNVGAADLSVGSITNPASPLPSTYRSSSPQRAE